MAGKSFPWKYIDGYYLRVRSFTRFAEMEGDSVGSGVLGVYGVIEAELPNPDVNPKQRIVSVPIEQKSDYKSVYRAHLDSGVKSGANELVVVYEQRRGLFGGRKPCIYVACYPAGTWQGFFKAVEKYASAEFRWPEPFFLYAPSPNAPFPPLRRVLQKIYFLHKPEHLGSIKLLPVVTLLLCRTASRLLVGEMVLFWDLWAATGSFCVPARHWRGRSLDSQSTRRILSSRSHRRSNRANS